MGTVTGTLPSRLHTMELDLAVRELKGQVAGEALSVSNVAGGLNKMQANIVSIEKEARHLVEQRKTDVRDKERQIETKGKEIKEIMKKLYEETEKVAALKCDLVKLERDKEALQKLSKSQDITIDGLAKKMSVWEKKVEFKSSLEKSFESLQVVGRQWLKIVLC